MSVNSIQIGGNHYKCEYQHWDLCWELHADWFQGCISKYLTRYPKKHKGMIDLEKSKHYLQKYIEVTKSSNVETCSCETEAYIKNRFQLLNKFYESNGIGENDSRRAIVDIIFNWHNMGQHALSEALFKLEDFMADQQQQLEISQSIGKEGK